MPRDTTGYEEEDTRRMGRGTRNARVSREATRPQYQPVHSSAGRVVEDFEREKSVQARTRLGGKKDRREKLEAENEAAELRAAQNEETEYQKQVRTGRMRGVQHKIGRVARGLKRKLAGSTKWILIGVVSFVCIIKALLMLIAIGLYAFGQFELFWGAFTVDEVVETVTRPLVWVGVLDSGATVSMFGIGVWVIVFLLVVFSYLVLILYYWLACGIDVFGSVAAFLATTIAIVFDLIPPLNIFPWMLLWVIYINGNALFLTKRSTVVRA